MPGPRKEGEPVCIEIPKERLRIHKMYSFQELDEIIRHVPLLDNSINNLFPYRQSEITLENISLDILYPSAQYVLEQNLAFQRELREAFIKRIRMDTLEMKRLSAAVCFSWGKHSGILVPPIIEVSPDDDDLHVITDGLHRVTLAKMLGWEKINAVIIKNTAVPLSVMPVEWEDVKIVNRVPDLAQKRKLRFSNTMGAFEWFSSSDNFIRAENGLSESEGLGYKMFFRDLNFDNLFPKENPFVKTKKECLEQYNSTGVLVTSMDASEVLLGTHQGAPTLWGNFAGSREADDTDPKDTATRELEEELGIKISKKVLGEPLIIIRNNKRNHIKVGIVYLLAIPKETNIQLPEDGKIEKVKWFTRDGVMALMDEHRPDVKLWGGIYTATALQEWIQLRHNNSYQDLIQFNAWHFGRTKFEELKNLVG